MPMTRQQRRAGERARAKKARRKLAAQQPIWEVEPELNGGEEEQFHLDVLRLKVDAFAAEHGVPVRAVMALLRESLEIGTLDPGGGYERASDMEIMEIASGNREL